MYSLHNFSNALVGPRLSSNSNESNLIATGSASDSGVVVRSRMLSYSNVADCGGLGSLILSKQ
jgi:hypothetical protein